jgi:ABC-2 type transport system permease protein
MSLTSLLRPFEQGLLSVTAVLGMLLATAGFLALAATWLPPGVPVGRKLKVSILIVGAVVILISGTAQTKTALDVTPDRRNSFPLTDEKLLGQLQDRLLVTVHMASSDPRLVDLDRKVLARVKRAMPWVTIRIAEPGQTSPFGTAGDEAYGEIVLTYHGKSATTRSTGAGEILPILYELAGVGLPTPGAPGLDELGYPLVADASNAAVWFYGLQPLAFAVVWWAVAANRRIPWRRS